MEQWTPEMQQIPDLNGMQLLVAQHKSVLFLISTTRATFVTLVKYPQKQDPRKEHVDQQRATCSSFLLLCVVSMTLEVCERTANG
jgi:hypothetical protein